MAGSGGREKEDLGARKYYPLVVVLACALHVMRFGTFQQIEPKWERFMLLTHSWKHSVWKFCGCLACRAVRRFHFVFANFSTGFSVRNLETPCTHMTNMPVLRRQGKDFRALSVQHCSDKTEFKES